jgi:ribose transport system substrate-binding protein
MRIRWTIAALATAALVLVAGCGGDDEGAAPATSDTQAETAVSEEPLEIAYLSASTANTWLASSKEAMEKFAGENNVTLTEFDAQFKLEEQTKQLQDTIASGKYDGIMLVPLGPGLIPDVQAAVDAGLKVGLLNQVLGDKFDTVEPQVEGVSVAVLAPPLRSGERLGELALKACEGKDPCRVVYFYGIKGIPLDVAMKQGFDAVTSKNPAVEIVAEGQGQYLGPDIGRKEMQDILQKTPDFDVVVGSDQSMQGAQQALEDAGKLDQVAVIGLGGSEAAIQAVKDGKWFGDVFGAPYTEGELAIKGLVDALRNEKDTGGIDPLTTIDDDGLVTKENVAKFESQWAG